MRLTMNPMNDDTQQGVTPVLDVVIPVHNEEGDLERSVRTLHAYLSAHIACSTRITVIDNASSDATREIGARLATVLHGVRFLHIDEKGRGRALRTAWLASDADVVAYMDVDLSTGLDALRPLVEPILAGDTDIAVGSRLIRGATVTRGVRRELISRCYNVLLRTVLHARFHDAQCGFKAMRRSAAHELLPLVRDQGWFFDTELLVLGQRAGMRIREIPVAWIDDPDSRVDVPSTAMTDLRGVMRMLRATRSARGALQPLTAHAPESR
jgi:glycosyltransferase involved in cell wall biosynthesis